MFYSIKVINFIKFAYYFEIILISALYHTPGINDGAKNDGAKNTASNKDFIPITIFSAIVIIYTSYTNSHATYKHQNIFTPPEQILFQKKLIFITFNIKRFLYLQIFICF